MQRLVDNLEFDKARAGTKPAIARNAADDSALHCMGVIALAANDPSSAAIWFDKAVKANDKVAAHHLWLANALGEQAPHTNRFELPFLAKRIKSEFDRSATLDSTSIAAKQGLIQFYSRAPSIMGGSMAEAEDQARAIGRLDAMRGHIEMAALLQRDRDLAGAERELDAAVAAAPDSVVAQYSLAALYQSEKRWPEAFAIYDRVIASTPSELMARFQYGRAAAISGTNLDRGTSELQSFIAAATDSVSAVTRAGAHVRLGAIYDRQGRKDAARAEYKAALAINPRNS
ncbi:MAG TPA: tetratricopeptide repeat protein, partial [Casimicrobiaceae bacterium]